MADAVVSRKMARRLLESQGGRQFAELTGKQVQRAVHRSTRQPDADIHAFIARHYDSSKPWRWTRSANQILAAVKQFCHKTQDTPHAMQRTSDSNV